MNKAKEGNKKFEESLQALQKDKQEKAELQKQVRMIDLLSKKIRTIPRNTD